VEWLTAELERQAEATFCRLDEWGSGSMLEGVLHGIDSGWFQSEIADSSYRFERKVNEGRRVVVGVNAFTDVGEEDAGVPILEVDPAVEESQLKRLAQVRSHRSDGAVRESLDRLRSAAGEPTTNVMPAILEAVRAYATLGEAMGALADVLGRYVEAPVL
ncbi:MAG: methylmalonyl-CoA mutase family protein, partial [Acidimicrobiales bacterium]